LISGTDVATPMTMLLVATLPAVLALSLFAATLALRPGRTTTKV